MSAIRACLSLLSLLLLFLPDISGQGIKIMPAPIQSSPLNIVLPKVEHIGVPDGLPFRDMLNFVQDQQGFFWFATKVGVFRYDGYQFVPLRTLANNGRLLPPAFARINLQPDGRLLLTVQETKFFIYDHRSNEVSVHPIHQLTNQKVLPVQHSFVWFEDDHSFMFEMRENGKRYLTRYTEGGSLSRIDSTALKSPDFFLLLKDPAGNMFWGTQEAGIRRYAPDGTLVDSLQLPFRNFDKNNPLWSNEFFPGANGELYVKHFEDNKIVIWDWKNHRLLPSIFTDIEINAYVVNDRAGNTWMINNSNLLLLDPEDRLYDLTPYLKEKADFSSLKMLREDNSGQIWATSDNGIFKLGMPQNQFTHYLSAPQPKWAKTTRGFFEDKNGTVYFRCESCGGQADSTIFRINSTLGKAESVPFATKDNQDKGLFAWAKYFLKMPGRETIWTIGKSGIVEMNLDHYTARTYPAVNTTFLVNNTAQIGWGMNRKGEILAGSRLSELLAFDPATDKIRFLLPDGVPDELDGFIRIILEAKDGTLWLGLASGLVQVDAAQGKILQRFGSDTHNALLMDDILTLFEDADSTIWAGIFAGGLVHFFPKTNEAVHFTTTDGLPDNIVAAILPWKDDYLWVSTFNGLTCFNKKEKAFVNFYEEDGLSHNEFNISSSFIDSKGRYYFGGMNGINAFYPEEIMNPQTKPLPLLLTGFSFFDEKKDTLAEQFGGLEALREVTFSPHVAWFQFNYALPDFVNPRLNQFQTWLEDSEKGWTYQGTTPFIRYNRLPAGNYVLHIKAADSKGYWSEDELAIQITVQQVFYKSWWFILSCCLMVGAGAFALLRFRYQQRLALERMRTRIAGDLHDEVGSSLSHLNFLVGSFDLENSPALTAKAIEKSKELMRKTASDIRDVVWAIDARRDKTGDLLDRMEDFAFDMFSVKNITCRFSAEGINREAALNPFVRQNIYLIFKESVNNIAKHSNATEVHISLTQKGEMLEMKVADNGKSVHESKVKGQGLENMQLRAQRIGGTVEIKQEESGFSVWLKVPTGSR